MDLLTDYSRKYLAEKSDITVSSSADTEKRVLKTLYLVLVCEMMFTHIILTTLVLMVGSRAIKLPYIHYLYFSTVVSACGNT